MKIAVISFNRHGLIIAQKLKEFVQADLYFKKDNESFNIIELTGRLVKEYEGIVFISSTGIAVRAIAPHIKSKDRDPAVVVIDNFGRYVISLLSGHLGGANELTVKLSEHLGAEPVITTATDILGIIAPDVIASENGLIIDSLKDAKEIAALLVDGKRVAFIDEENKIGLPAGYCDNLDEASGIVYVTSNISDVSRFTQSGLRTLKLIRKNIVLGIGCRKEYSSEKMLEKVLQNLYLQKIDSRAVGVISTIEVKKNENAILELAEYFKVDLKIFSKDEIKEIQHKYEGSDFVEKSIGVRAVCEPCVELSGGELLTGKISCDGMTLCIGRLK